MNISVKEELQGLQYDINTGREAGSDTASLLAIVDKKINNIMKLDSANYAKVVWKND